ncbi:MAG: L-cystine transporter [SAR86 cluster bacterium]|uniref:L-cystine transporter n=1 Tax=SAR86 cluster bacterium TaxID=2030880 RepID=A0A2A4MM55_9GAMM|nr:MAG: L-cystine transporter [SAR86 cluster bacterium]
MGIFTIANLLVFTGLLFLLAVMSKKSLGLSKQVLLGLVTGSVFGFALQLSYSENADILSDTLQWTSVVGDTYVHLLRMIIMPLILFTMISAVLKVEDIKSLGKIGGTVVTVLIMTTVIAALVGIAIASSFGLSADGMMAGTAELAKAEEFSSRAGSLENLSIAELIVSFVPTNIFYDLTGARDTSIISVVIFAMLTGLACLLVAQENPKQGQLIKSFVDAAQTVVMKLVKIVMSLTPYGVMALMTKVIASSDGGAIISLIEFVIASYLAIAIMFVVHAFLVGLVGVNIRDYFRKVWPVLSFAFVTRSSAATIPLTIKALTEELNIPAPIANIAASFGATIGQNGCAGIYPAMLAVMVAPTMGVDVDLSFIISLVLIVAIGSFGIAGVGGGATNAALVVLPAMGFPVIIAALLISIEPLIDMARTALNVNGAMTSGVITDKLFGKSLGDKQLSQAEADLG